MRLVPIEPLNCLSQVLFSIALQSRNETPYTAAKLRVMLRLLGILVGCGLAALVAFQTLALRKASRRVEAIEKRKLVG